jgi:hypothetical protein
MHEVPLDRLVRAQGIRFAALEDGLRMVIGGQPAEIHPHALDQTAERSGLNRRFLHELIGQGATWAHQLVAHNLNELLIHQTPATRYLVRDVGGRVRGVLSDAYRRIDSRPTVDAITTAAQEARAIIVDGIYTETRVSLKVVRPAPVLKSRTNKGEAAAIVEKFDSADVVELPPGQTVWRLSNAISWLAKNTEDDRRRLELERLAGEVMT